MAKRERIPILWHVGVALFVCAWIVLGIRPLYTDDFRFGWAMFSYRIDYTVEYALVRADGTLEPYKVPEPFVGLVRRRLLPGKRHSTYYGLGAVRSWIKAYARTVGQSLDGATTLRATLSYQKNKGPLTTETLFFPAQ
jgi:hypothetical protein